MGYQVTALASEPFEALFALDNSALAARHARRLTVDSCPGFPCRVTLRDAQRGETVIALPYDHLPESSPYQARGPIFVREGAKTRSIAPNHLPAMLRARPQSVRAYSRDHLMIAAEIADGDELKGVISQLLADANVAYFHLHNAKPGCFNCRVDRTTD